MSPSLILSTMSWSLSSLKPDKSIFRSFPQLGQRTIICSNCGGRQCSNLRNLKRIKKSSFRIMRVLSRLYQISGCFERPVKSAFYGFTIRLSTIPTSNATMLTVKPTQSGKLYSKHQSFKAPKGGDRGNLQERSTWSETTLSDNRTMLSRTNFLSCEI